MNTWILRNRIFLIFVCIIATAIFLRFYDLGRADLITDEASINWRAIGYLDFLGTPYQTTPIEWLHVWPWWFNISFHDLPPLFFLVQHWMFGLLGVSVVTMRIVPVIAGLGSIILMYVIGRSIIGERFALVAAALMAVNDYHIWISRIALQESLVIFFILAALFSALKAKVDPRWWYAFGICAGLAIMTKIHGVIIIPIVLTYYLIVDRTVWHQRQLYWSWVIIALVISPYVIYNVMMYRTFGHFDFQFSYIFHQQVEAWSIRPGRAEFPTTAMAARYLFINSRDGFSPLFVAGCSLAILYCVYAWRRLDTAVRQNVVLYTVGLSWTVVLLLVIGPSRRFLTLAMPWLFFFVAFVIARIQWKRWIMVSLAIAWFSYEVLFSYQTSLAPTPWLGTEGWGYSRLRYQVQPYGYRALEAYIDQLLANKKPAVTLPVTNTNLRNYTAQRVTQLQGTPAAFMIIHDPRMYGEEVFWILTRRLIYEGWPVLSYGVYQEAVESNGSDFFQTMGITDFYFIDAHANQLQSPTFNESIPAVDTFIDLLKQKATVDRVIIDEQGQTIFTIYHFQAL